MTSDLVYTVVSHSIRGWVETEYLHLSAPRRTLGSTGGRQWGVGGGEETSLV